MSITRRIEPVLLVMLLASAVAAQESKTRKQGEGRASEAEIVTRCRRLPMGRGAAGAGRQA